VSLPPRNPTRRGIKGTEYRQKPRPEPTASTNRHHLQQTSGSPAVTACRLARRSTRRDRPDDLEPEASNLAFTYRPSRSGFPGGWPVRRCPITADPPQAKTIDLKRPQTTGLPGQTRLHAGRGQEAIPSRAALHAWVNPGQQELAAQSVRPLDA
jgi:hypothetical protein